MAGNDAPSLEALRSVTQAGDERLTPVIGELVLPTAMTPADIAAFEDSCAWCFQTHRVELIQLFLSRDRKQAVIVFRAPDAESVRMVCRSAGLPVQRIWACQER